MNFVGTTKCTQEGTVRTFYRRSSDSAPSLALPETTYGVTGIPSPRSTGNIAIQAANQCYNHPVEQEAIKNFPQYSIINVVAV